MKKRVLSIVLCLVMLVGVLSVGAFAAGDPTVTIYVQSLSRGEDGMIEPDTVDIFNQNNPIVVSVQSGATLKDAINAACAEPGSIIANPVWNPEYPQYLEALSVNNEPYENKDDYYTDPDTGKPVYSGSSWLYFFGTPEQIPPLFDNYPDTTLGETPVTSDTVITLSYENLTFEYE